MCTPRSLTIATLVSPFAFATAHDIVLRAADTQSVDYPPGQGLHFMADTLEAASDGRIVMEVFSGGQLGGTRSTIEQVQLGVLNVVRTSTRPDGASFEPVGNVSLPYLYRGKTAMWKVANGPIGRELLDGLADCGMVGLAYDDSGSRNFYTTETPVRSFPDLEGLGSRIQQSQVAHDMMEALGAEPVPRTTPQPAAPQTFVTLRLGPTSTSTVTLAGPRSS